MKNKLSNFIDSQGTTAYGLSRRTGVCKSVIYKLYHDRDRIPSGRTIAAICEAYKVQPQEILLVEALEDEK